MQRKKSSRQRGETTHGCGSMKKRRGAGNRGGRGNAGTGKRGDANKGKIWGNSKYFGKYGFTSKQVQKKEITLRTINASIPKWLDKKKATKEGDSITINLEKLGYSRVIHTGKLDHKVKLIVSKVTPKAAEAIKAAGGETQEA